MVMRNVVVATLAIAFLSLVFAACSGPHAYVARKYKPTPQKRAFSELTLDNGMRVLVHERDNGGPTAIQLWVGGGSLADPSGKAGLSHFVEHMLFTGARELSPGKDGLPGETVESMGGRIDGQTGRDYSFISINLPGDGWEQAVRILYDMVSTTGFAEKDVEAEKKTISEELLRRELSPDLAALEAMFQTAYEKHPYKQPVAGTPESVAAITAADAKALLKNVYVPANMTLVVSGNVKPLRVKTVAHKTFGTMSDTKLALPETDPEPYQIANRDDIIERDTRLSYLALGWHICNASEKDIYALDVLRALLGLGRGSVLSMNIMERRRLVVDISAELFATRDPGMFAITAKLRPDDAKRATEEIIREINDIKQKPPEDFMVRDAIKSMEAAHTLETRDAEGQAFALGYWATVYGWGQQADYMDIVSEVTPADLQRVAQKYLGAGNYTLVVVGQTEVKE